MMQKRLEGREGITTGSRRLRGDVLVVLFAAGFRWDRPSRERCKTQSRKRKMDGR